MRSWTRGFDTARTEATMATGAATDVLVASAAARRVVKTRPWYLEVWVHMVRRKPLGTAGGVIVLVMLLGAVLADVVSPYGFAQTSLRERFISISASHWLGTDQLGRDLLT